MDSGLRKTVASVLPPELGFGVLDVDIECIDARNAARADPNQHPTRSASGSRVASLKPWGDAGRFVVKQGKQWWPSDASKSASLSARAKLAALTTRPVRAEDYVAKIQPRRTAPAFFCQL